jgi:uncharacterized protein
MGKEFKAFPFEFKMSADKRTLEGYASTHDRDQVGDIVQPGAFSKTLKERGPAEGRKSKIKFLWQHDPYQPLGPVVRMSEDSKGLHVEAKFSKTTLGNDAITLVEDEALDSLSIGYDVIKDEYDTAKATRYLNELKLYEFSLVTFPANEAATVSGVKAYDQLAELLHKTGRTNVSEFLKEGRTLSKANKELIETAIKALQDILAISEPDNSTQKSQMKPLDNISDWDWKELSDLANNFKITK